MAKAGTQKKTNAADRDFSLSASIGERAGVRCRIQMVHATGSGNRAKGDIWWQSARTFGQGSNPTTWRLARMNRCVSNPKSKIGNPKLNGWGGNRLREDARWKFGVPPAGNANDPGRISRVLGIRAVQPLCHRIITVATIGSPVTSNDNSHATARTQDSKLP